MYAILESMKTNKRVAAYLNEKFLVEIAKELVLKLDESNQVKSSKELEVAFQEENELFTSLLEKLDSEELKQNLMDYDDQTSFRATLMSENYFIRGYLEGYKAAKSEQEGNKW